MASLWETSLFTPGGYLSSSWRHFRGEANALLSKLHSDRWNVFKGAKWKQTLEHIDYVEYERTFWCPQTSFSWISLMSCFYFNHHEIKFDETHKLLKGPACFIIRRKMKILVYRFPVMMVVDICISMLRRKEPDPQRANIWFSTPNPHASCTATGPIPSEPGSAWTQTTNTRTQTHTSCLAGEAMH